MTERLRPHNWDDLSPEARAAVDRTVAKARPAEELDAEHCRRLASLLGLGSGLVESPDGDGVS